jgi:predicted nucleotidyltransferase
MEPPRFAPSSAILDLTRRISAFPSVRRILLYGSRAKGKARWNSDIDLAVEGVVDPAEWTQILRLVDIEESPVRTLLKIDLTRIEQADSALRRSIEMEGKLLYERQ